MAITTVNLSDEVREKIEELREKTLPKLNTTQWIEKACWEKIKREEKKSK